ncbi:glycosyltransferase family 2 protein [Aestuariivivens sediminicola]|uniref:glycosyltransferase family 2 protein n=1 Tax=Aestuariivivens sediminicola TaxID=2913560 RepID=UPI001F59113B|nr:glycosyltransferase family 2 protein [Aestuariivivens sediminicola]
MKVSVLMITYNHENYIIDAIEGVLNQKVDFEYELIISNDCSEDGSHSVISKYIKENDSNHQIRYFNQTYNMGMHLNFKFAHSKARGEFIAICEGDDFWIHEEKLQRQVDFLDKHSAYSLCYTRFNTYNEQTKTLALDLNEKYFSNKQDFIDFDFDTFQKGWHIGNQTLVFRNIFFDYSIYSRYKNIRDVHLVTHLLNSGKGACLNFVSANYRIHRTGIHSEITNYKGFYIGYKTHEEIYLNNKTNDFLKKRHLMSMQNFISINIKKGFLRKALGLSLKMYYREGNVSNFMHNFFRILKKGLITS